MWSVVKRLSLGIVLIVSAAAVLLIADRGRRSAGTQPTKVWKIDVLEYVKVPDVEEGEHGLRAGLQEAALVDGRDYTLDIRNAQGDMATLTTLVDAALSENSDPAWQPAQPEATNTPCPAWSCGGSTAVPAMTESMSARFENSVRS